MIRELTYWNWDARFQILQISAYTSRHHKLHPFFERDKDLCQEIREDMTGGPSLVFTRKDVVDQAFIRNSSNICKT